MKTKYGVIQELCNELFYAKTMQKNCGYVVVVRGGGVERVLKQFLQQHVLAVITVYSTRDVTGCNSSSSLQQPADTRSSES